MRAKMFLVVLSVSINLLADVSHAQPQLIYTHGNGVGELGEIVEIPVFLDNLMGQDVQGFSVAVCFDPAPIAVLGIQEGQDLVDPEFFGTFVDNLQGSWSVGVIIDIEPPFDGGGIPPGVGHEILIVSYGIDVPGPETVALEFCGPLDPLADYIGGRLFIGFQPFRRGDVSGNGVIDLPDAVFGLNYLFAQGATPGCLDTLDWDDDGGAGLVDMLALLGYLFVSGPPPAAPGLECGEDPTADAIPCDEYDPDSC